MKELLYLNVDQLIPHPDNPRKDIGDITELAESIKACGVLQNLTVVPCPAQGKDKYVVVIGHRRLAASKLAGLTEVPCVVAEMSPQEQLTTMLLENIERSDLTPYEQAQGFQLLIDFGETVNTISERTGFSKSTVRRRLKMAELDQTKLAEKSKARQISLFEVERLCDIEDEAMRDRALDAVGTPEADNAYHKAMEKQAVVKGEAKWRSALEAKGIRLCKSEELDSTWAYPDPYYIDVKDEPTEEKIAEYIREGEYVAIPSGRYIYLRIKREKQEAPVNTEWVEKEAERKAKVAALKEATDRARACRYDWLARNPRAFSSNTEGVCSILYRVLLDRDNLGKKYTGVGTATLAELGTTEDNIGREVPAVAIGRILLAWLDRDNATYVSWSGAYDESRALNAVYDLLACVGYDPSTEEIELLNGTSALYGGDDE